MSTANVDQLVALVRREVALYRSLLQEQESKLELFLERKQADMLSQSARETDLVEEIKRLERDLKSALQGKDLAELMGELRPPHRLVLESLVQQFRRLIKELNLINLRNFRYLNRAYGLTATTLQQILTAGSQYDSKGYLRGGLATGGPSPMTLSS